MIKAKIYPADNGNPGERLIDMTLDGTWDDLTRETAAIIRRIWWHISADDQEEGYAFRRSLTRVVNDPGFWTREEPEAMQS